MPRCGQETRVCEESCGWGPWRVVNPSGICEAGEEDFRSCGPCAAEVRVCNDQCEWGEYGECLGGGVCEPAEMEEVGCGNCGVRSRVCGNECIWGDFTSNYVKPTLGKAKIGYVMCIFGCADIMFSYVFGKISDMPRIGRMPVLAAGALAQLPVSLHSPMPVQAFPSSHRSGAPP